MEFYIQLLTDWVGDSAETVVRNILQKSQLFKNYGESDWTVRESTETNATKVPETTTIVLLPGDLSDRYQCTFV